MSKAELEKMIVEETKDLPTEILIEVLDFIQKVKEYKRKRKKLLGSRLTKELTELNQISLAHLEEEFANYKELYPRE